MKTRPTILTSQQAETYLDEFYIKLEKEICKYDALVSQRIDKRQSLNRKISIQMLLKEINTIRKINDYERPPYIKVLNFISLVKGHMRATIDDHKNTPGCFTFWKRFTKSDLVRAYENILKVFPIEIVKKTQGWRISFTQKKVENAPQYIDLDSSLRKLDRTLGIR